jgi:hypothetical protein
MKKMFKNKNTIKKIDFIDSIALRIIDHLTIIDPIKPKIKTDNNKTMKASALPVFLSLCHDSI